MQRKISADRGKTVYPPPPLGSGSIVNYIYHQLNRKQTRRKVLVDLLVYMVPSLRLDSRSPKGEGGILFYLCLPIFFVAFFSVTVDGRNLIFGHKHHIGIPYCG
jgi:hypothetical protein